MLSYDPDKTPGFDPEADAFARSMGLRAISVICEEPGAKVGDQTGVSFVAYVDFVPRIGEEIILQDGHHCVVKRIVYKVTKPKTDGSFVMVSNVIAVRKSRHDSD